MLRTFAEFIRIQGGDARERMVTKQAQNSSSKFPELKRLRLTELEMTLPNI